ncbi:MAG: deoxyribonuclease IV [Candidatus Omnitrophica bacterium]|nr:deoxyribonuclease IV [Candidatus Omnitrophota bacterium]
MFLGVHISTAGRIYLSIDRAVSLGCNTMQIFSRSPRSWRQAKLNQEDIEEFKQRRKKANIGPIFIHIPYLINLASPLKKLYLESIKAYIEDIKEAGSLGAEYLVTHMGSHKKRGEESGLRRFAQALNIIIKETEKQKVTILLENTSGSGSWLGYKFGHHQMIIDRIEDKDRVGICFDTCHAYSAGYDIATNKGLDETLDEIDNLVGLNRLRLVHLNDTKDKLASGKDRHEHIGKGEIGLDGFKRIINHAKLKDVPFILETPKDAERDDVRNLSVVRRLRGLSV